MLSKEYIAPDFDKKAYTLDLQKQINTDRKKNPFKYGTLPTGGGNIANLIRLVAWLLKDKDKNKDEEQVRTVVFDELTHLFKNDTFFTEELLIRDLKVPKDQIELFFMYCEAQSINSELLGSDRKFELLDQLVIHSGSFMSRLNGSSED
ncbi:hypothetical protein [Galbibacter sp.]|uniref:hypothetical protein n=1 Tax=Galbibacter sp. TaxID=2918471 RepID=UPI003A8E6678